MNFETFVSFSPADIMARVLRLGQFTAAEVGNVLLTSKALASLASNGVIWERLDLRSSTDAVGKFSKCAEKHGSFIRVVLLPTAPYEDWEWWQWPTVPSLEELHWGGSVTCMGLWQVEKCFPGLRVAKGLNVYIGIDDDGNTYCQCCGCRSQTTPRTFRPELQDVDVKLSLRCGDSVTAPLGAAIVEWMRFPSLAALRLSHFGREDTDLQNDLFRIIGDAPRPRKFSYETVDTPGLSPAFGAFIASDAIEDLHLRLETWTPDLDVLSEFKGRLSFEIHEESPEHLEHLARFVSTKDVYAFTVGRDAGGKILAALEGCTSLREFSVYHPRGGSSAKTYADFIRGRALTTLRFERCGFSADDAALIIESAAPSVRSFNFTENDIDDAGAVQLSGMNRHGAALILVGCNLSSEMCGKLAASGPVVTW